MKPKFSHAYLDTLFAPGRYESLVELSSLLCGSEVFSPAREDYGFTPRLFVFVESLAWFAQSVRSGTWTYFEATPPNRQACMLSALTEEAPVGFAENYAIGMANWQDESTMKRLDQWMVEHDNENNQWLCRLAQEQRDQFLQAVA